MFLFFHNNAILTSLASDYNNNYEIIVVGTFDNDRNSRGGPVAAVKRGGGGYIILVRFSFIFLLRCITYLMYGIFFFLARDCEQRKPILLCARTRRRSPDTI